MIKHLSATLLLVVALTSTRAAGPTIAIDAASPAGNVSRLFYGLMTEEINHAYDGGLYAELVQNRAFLDDASAPAHWSVVQGAGAAAAIALDKSQPLNDTIRTSLRLDVTQASTGHAAGRGERRLSGASPSSRTPATAPRSTRRRRPDSAARSRSRSRAPTGRRATPRRTVAGLTGTWKQYELTLQTGSVTPTTAARYVLARGSARHGVVQPRLAVPADLQESAERLPGRHHADDGRHEAEVPALPGRQLPRRATRSPIGSSGRRRSGRSRTVRATWRRGAYRSSDGLGLHEFLLWCEDMDAEPVLAVYAGYSLKGAYVKPGPDLEPYIQDALDEIEYVIGPADIEVGRAAREGRAPAAVHADLRRGRQRRLVRQVRVVRSAIRPVQQRHQGALPAAQSDLDASASSSRSRGASTASSRTSSTSTTTGPSTSS